jgi:DNA repair exonuclease SbcCD ATPase subunit
MDQLSTLINSKFDSLTVTAPLTMKTSDIVYEVQALAAQIEEKERQLREQQQIIDELKKTKQNRRLRAELDIAQNELQSLQSSLKVGRDIGGENDQLRRELRQLRERKSVDLEDRLSDLRVQLARQHDVSQEAAAKASKDFFSAFIGSVMEKLAVRVAGHSEIPTREMTGIIYDVFLQSSEDLLKHVEDNGLL